MGRFSPFAGFLLKYLFIFSSISVNFARSLPFMKKTKQVETLSGVHCTTLLRKRCFQRDYHVKIT